MPLTSGNLLSHLPTGSSAEIFEPLLEAQGIRLERIVSTGQITPEGEWLVQDWDEWVVLPFRSRTIWYAGHLAPQNSPNDSGHD